MYFKKLLSILLFVSVTSIAQNTIKGTIKGTIKENRKIPVNFDAIQMQEGEKYTLLDRFTFDGLIYYAFDRHFLEEILKKIRLFQEKSMREFSLIGNVFLRIQCDI